MGPLWTPIATAMLIVSAVATFLTMLHLRFGWDIRASSVRWLFWQLFLFLWAWCTLRAIYFLWLCLLPSDRKRIMIANSRWTSAQLEHIGIHAILHLEEARTVWVTTVFCLGDVALLGVALTLIPLTYELWRLARTSMDRGVKKELRQMRWYFCAIYGLVALFAAVEAYLAIRDGGYSYSTHRCLLATYVVQFVGLAFMVIQLVILKVKGRKYETVHGTFITSPAYQRLKRIMWVYALFSFQFQLSSFVLYVFDPRNDEAIVDSIGLSLIAYNMTGLVLAITTSCSQACVLSVCACCLPDEFEPHFRQQQCSGASTAPLEEDLEAPRVDPVFVFTDIESSSALWAMSVDGMMDEATEIHDNILRSTLPKYRGYEITTVGDAFQLAFHSIRDAVEYCMDVQLQLLVAEWPKSLHGAVPATAKQRSGRRMLFNGLRVRMGIHDAIDYEGVLIQDTHAVTGKTTYTGVSAVVAEFVGDLGSGGQILVTGRVARYLRYRSSEISLAYDVDRVGQYSVPQVNMDVEIFQLTPSLLKSRSKFFAPPEKNRSRLAHRPRPNSRRVLPPTATTSPKYAGLESTQERPKLPF